MSTDNTIGIRLSADAKELQAALSSGSGYIDGFATSARKSLNAVSKETDGLNASMESMASGIKSAFVGGSMAVGLISLKNMVSDVGQELIATQIAADKLRNGLKFAVGGGAVAAEMDFLRNTTQKLGLEFVSASDQYMKLAAAAKGTALEGGKTRDIFTGIAQASTVMGMSAQETEGALRAIGQMISKNTIMSEELKGQLSEHLSGAFGIAARAMGVTTEELNKMLETGQVVATDFLPKFAAELTKTFGRDSDEASKSLQASVNRMSFAWLELKQNINASGTGKAIQNEIMGMGNYVQSVSDAMERARQNGSGTLMQWSAALGEMIARAPFDTLSLASNTLNGSLNFLSGGALQLNTSLNLLPAALDTNRKRMDAMVAALPQAQADFERLSASLAKVPDNIYLKSEVHQLYLFIEKAKEAKLAKDRLDGKVAAEDATSAGVTASGRAREAYYVAQKKAETDLIAIRQKLSGVDKDYLPTLEKLQTARDRGLLGEKEYVALVSDLATSNHRKATSTTAQATAYDTLRASIAKNMAMAQEEMASNGKVSASERQRIDSLNAINEALHKKTITAKQAGELSASANAAADARAVAEANTEQQKYLKTLNEKIAVQQLGVQSTAALTEGEKLAAKFTQDLADGTLVLSEAHKIERTEALERLIASEKQNTAMQAQEKLQAAEIKSLQDSAASMVQKALQIEDEVALYGMSEEAIKALTIARLEDEKAVQMSYGNTAMVDALEAQIAAIKRLAKAKDALKVKDDSADAAKKLAAEMQKAADEINRTLTDSLMRAFENGEGYGRAFAKTVEAMFKTMVLRPIISAVMTPVSGAVSSVLGSIGVPGLGQAASGALSGGSNPLSGITSSLTGSFGLGMQGTIATIAEQGFIGGFSNAMTSAKTLASAGDFLGAAGSALPYAGAAIAGLAAIKALTDYKIEATGNALVANLGGGSTVVANRNDYKQTGGLFGGGTTNNSEWSAASAELTAYMDAQVKLVTESARAYGTALGLPVADLDSFKQQIEVSLTGLNADQAKEAINKAIGGFGDALVSANFGPALDGLKRSGETSSATLVRVASQLTTVNGTLGMLGGKLLSVDAAGIKAADGLVQAMGGLEAFQQQTASYYNDYYTEEEKRLNTAKDIQSQLANAGIEVSLQQVLDGTKEQFRALVESFGTDTSKLDENGQKAVAALLSVAGAFAKIAKIEPPKIPQQTASGGNDNSSDPITSVSGWWREDVAKRTWTAASLEGVHNRAGRATLEGKDLAAQLAELKEQLRVSQLSAEELAAEEAIRAQKSLEWIDPTNREAYKEILALKEKLSGGGNSGSGVSAADEKKSLQEQYNQLTMTSVELRALERTKISEGNRELFDKITALQKEQAITAQGKTLQEQYNQLTMTETQLRAIERKTIDATNLEIFDRITALKAEQAAISEANAKVDTAFAGVQRAIEAERKGIAAAKQAAQERVSIFKSIVDGLGSAINDLRGNVTGAKEQSARVANAFIDNALATAKATGYMADPKALLDAVSKARAGISAEGMTRFEYERANLVLAGKLEGIKEIADPQLTAAQTAVELAEKQLKTLDDQLAAAKESIDVLRGIDTSVKTVAQAMAALALALKEVKNVSGPSWMALGGPLDPGYRLPFEIPGGVGLGGELGPPIYPQEYRPVAGGQSGNARLESLVEGLTKEVQRLQTIVNDGNASNERIATAVNGRPDRPMLVETVV